MSETIKLSYSLGGTKRIMFDNEYRQTLSLETSPGICINFELVGEDDTSYVYMPPIKKHTCLGCIYSYTIDQRKIRVYKYTTYIEYITSKRSSYYKME